MNAATSAREIFPPTSDPSSTARQVPRGRPFVRRAGRTQIQSSGAPWSCSSILPLSRNERPSTDGADVARLRWTMVSGDGKYKSEAATSGSQTPTQVAVTDKGIYLLTADMDDAKVSKALKGKPSRSDPPKAYKGTKKNNGRFLTVSGDVVCMGEEPLPDAGECADICEGEICYSATDGVISMTGTLAPDHYNWEQK